MLTAIKNQFLNIYTQVKSYLKSLKDFLTLDKLIYLITTALASIGFFLMKQKVRIYLIRTLLGFIFTYQISLLIGIIIGYVFEPSI